MANGFMQNGDKSKAPAINSITGGLFFDEPGKIRTYDPLIKSQLRYRCATGPNNPIIICEKNTFSTP